MKTWIFFSPNFTLVELLLRTIAHTKLHHTQTTAKLRACALTHAAWLETTSAQATVSSAQATNI